MSGVGMLFSYLSLFVLQVVHVYVVCDVFHICDALCVYRVLCSTCLVAGVGGVVAGGISLASLLICCRFHLAGLICCCLCVWALGLRGINTRT